MIKEYFPFNLFDDINSHIFFITSKLSKGSPPVKVISLNSFNQFDINSYVLSVNSLCDLQLSFSKQ